MQQIKIDFTKKNNTDQNLKVKITPNLNNFDI